jgi:hypothetical protein
MQREHLLERGRLLTLGGLSMRTRNLGLDQTPAEASNQGADNLARLSGIARSESPEPTRGDTSTLKELLEAERDGTIVLDAETVAERRCSSPTRFLS